MGVKFWVRSPKEGMLGWVRRRPEGATDVKGVVPPQVYHLRSSGRLGPDRTDDDEGVVGLIVDRM